MDFSNRNKKNPLLAKIKFEPTFFQILWRFAFSLPLQGEADGKGVWGEFRPPSPRSGRAKRFFSQLAEGVGFEPTRAFLLYRISSAADSATFVPLLFLFIFCVLCLPIFLIEKSIYQKPSQRLLLNYGLFLRKSNRF